MQVPTVECTANANKICGIEGDKLVISLVHSNLERISRPVHVYIGSAECIPHAYQLTRAAPAGHKCLKMKVTIPPFSATESATSSAPVWLRFQERSSNSYGGHTTINVSMELEDFKYKRFQKEWRYRQKGLNEKLHQFTPKIGSRVVLDNDTDIQDETWMYQDLPPLKNSTPEHLPLHVLKLPLRLSADPVSAWAVQQDTMQYDTSQPADSVLRNTEQIESFGNNPPLDFATSLLTQPMQIDPPDNSQTSGIAKFTSAVLCELEETRENVIGCSIFLNNVEAEMAWHSEDLLSPRSQSKGCTFSALDTIIRKASLKEYSSKKNTPQHSKIRAKATGGTKSKSATDESKLKLDESQETGMLKSKVKHRIPRFSQQMLSELPSSSIESERYEFLRHWQARDRANMYRTPEEISQNRRFLILTRCKEDDSSSSGHSIKISPINEGDPRFYHSLNIISVILFDGYFYITQFDAVNIYAYLAFEKEEGQKGLIWYTNSAKKKKIRSSLAVYSCTLESDKESSCELMDFIEVSSD